MRTNPAIRSVAKALFIDFRKKRYPVPKSIYEPNELWDHGMDDSQKAPWYETATLAINAYKEATK